ncbi:MAG: cytochrome b N-terminal domain-containing protein [Rhodospirillaceae bacterium]|jgi:quinol-cytochrome oxidoreductase complex cytochrome b subunit|nr:cytochrome b N-terminal domain-containing protein [Rhodospirillaceae bacterium]
MSTEKSWGTQAFDWFEERLPIVSFIDNTVGSKYPAPKNLNYFWNFGALAGFVMVIMILTGILLAMSYTPHVDHAFQSVERIMRDVNSGWLLRYMHANGASFFFIVVYIHIFRGLYYGSYKAPREVLWWLGIIIMLIMMMTAFTGYVLPWGQMSFWGATVITNLFSAIPVIGDEIVTLLWGGFSVDNPTLNRFFALHFLMPFVLVGVVILHVWALHIPGSNNPLGINATPKDKIPFHPYYTAKDVFGLGVFLLVYFTVVFWFPNAMGHTDNYIPANPLSTPAHIVPEWYFLPFYAILRSIDDKLTGVILMFGSILILFVIPWLDTSRVRSATFRPIFRVLFWIFLIDCVVLTWCGAQLPEGIPLILTRVGTFWYFFHFLVLMPVIGWIETPRPLPTSISTPVVAKPAE